MRKNPHYLDLTLLKPFEDPAQRPRLGLNPLWWVAAGLILLTVFLVSTSMTAGVR